MHTVTERCAGIPGGRAPEFPATMEEPLEEECWQSENTQGANLV